MGASRPGLAAIAVRGAGLSAGGFLFAQVLNLGAYVVLARLLTPSEFGTFAAATALLGFTLLLTESGLTSALVQRREGFEQAANTALVASIAGGFAFGLLALASAPLLGLFFDSSQVTAIAAAMAGMVTLRILTVVPDAILQRRFAFLRRLVIEPAFVLTFAFSSILAAANDLGPWSLVIGQYAGTLVDVALSWGLVRWRPRPRTASVATWRELVGFGRHVLVATTILRAGEQSDSLVVGGFIGTAGLGQFRYAFRVASMPFLALLSAAAYVLYPAFARIAEERDRFTAAFLRAMRWTVLIAVPAGVVLVPLGEPLTVIVFGEQWRPAGQAAMAMFAYTGGLMVSSIVSEGLKARGRPDRLTPLHAVTTVVTVGALVALAPVGLTAAAAALSLGAIVAAAYGLRLARDTLGIPLASMLEAFRAPLLASLAMAAVLIPVELLLDAESQPLPLNLVSIAGEGALAAAVYLLTARLLWPELGPETRRVIALLRKRPSGPEPEQVSELPQPDRPLED